MEQNRYLSMNQLINKAENGINNVLEWNKEAGEELKKQLQFSKKGKMPSILKTISFFEPTDDYAIECVERIRDDLISIVCSSIRA